MFHSPEYRVPSELRDFGTLNFELVHFELRPILLRPVEMEELPARLIDSLVGVCAEVVALRLKQIRGKPCRAVAVEIRQRAGERGNGDAVDRGTGHDGAPVVLPLGDHAGEVRIEKEVGQLRVPGIRVGDLLEEPRADDAPAAEDRSDLAKL